MQSTTKPLSERSKAIILGSLLGDGSLKIYEPYTNARFSFRHSVRQEEYFFWKANALKEISSEKNIWKQGVHGRDGWGGEKLRFQSRALPALTEIYRLTHQGKTFHIRRKWLNMLTPLSIAVWWFDDGSLVSDSRQGVLCTDGFTLQGVRVLDRYMKKVWGISTTVGQVGNTGRYRLWIRSTRSLQDFLRIILPHTSVASMLTKALLLYRDAQLQQRWISEVIAKTGFSRQIVMQCLQEKKSKWRRFRE